MNLFHNDYIDFDWNQWKITVCSWPVIFDEQWQVLLHVSKSTWKYQFIGGRLDDSLSLRENLFEKSLEVLWHSELEIINDTPLCILWDIQRDGKAEKVLLHHYKSELTSEKIWSWEWKTLSEIEELSKHDMLSSPNILLAVKHFS